MSKIAIITAIYDKYDTVKPILEQSVDVEWIMVTDNRDHWPWYGGWRTVYEPRSHLHPNRAAKLPKCLPWLYTDAEVSIWIDASYQVKSSHFAIEALSYADPIAQFVHPWRDCIYAEAEESLKLAKYDPERDRIRNQIEEANDLGHPAHWGLWATGVIARKHTREVMRMGFDWFQMLHEYSYQDQLSHPVVCRVNGLYPNGIPGTHLSNDWLEYQGSGRH